MNIDTHSGEATTDDPVLETIGELGDAPDRVVEVRRRAGLAVALGVGASLVGVAYLARAAGGGGFLDWALGVVLALIGIANLAALLDARTPLLVADAFGVRLRLGRTWVGLPWGGIEGVEHRPRRGGWRDGLLVVRPRYVQRIVEDLDPSARRLARLNRRLHGAPLAVPLTLATRLRGVDTDLASVLRELAGGQSAVTEPRPAQLIGPVPEEDDDAAAPSPSRRLPDPRPALARLIATVSSGLARAPHDPGEDLVEEAALEASATPEPVRETAAAARAEVRRESKVELDPFVEETQVWAELHDAADATGTVAPRVIDEYAPEPAADPEIGPRFAAARGRLGLSIDALADRTRIRPHVIEAIEVDDFSACGGDFYARGHLRTLARVLGVEVSPLLETYDERYADAPIDPRRIFEAELAGAGSIRATRGGPNWSVLVAAVMALVLCWSIARLVTDGSSHLADRAILSGSGGPNHATTVAAKPVPVVLTATAGGARVVVRNGGGKVVFAGDLAIGQSHTLQASPPVRVQSTDGSVRVTVAGQDRGRMGPAGRPVTSSYVVRP
jgi:Helix-turn-helix domain